ncbi:MAG: hypothetical protein QXT77_07545 [Candidatus Methanomethylicaceae archaeon]
MLQEEKRSRSALFVTLTFNTEFVPITENGFMTLCKREFQLFMKRLRKNSRKDEKVSYFACGEYGSRNWRPHYHAIIFNTSREIVERSWQRGDIHVGQVSGASIAYTLKYMNKGKLIPVHQNDDRVPEFSLMSKGLGSNYLTDEIKRYYKNDLSRAYVTNPDGVKIALPRYYKNKIYTENEQKEQAFICKRAAEEADRIARVEYSFVNGSEAGYEDQVESGQRSRYFRHRKQGLENRKL